MGGDHSVGPNTCASVNLQCNFHAHASPLRFAECQMGSGSILHAQTNSLNARSTTWMVSSIVIIASRSSLERISTITHTSHSVLAQRSCISDVFSGLNSFVNTLPSL